MDDWIDPDIAPDMTGRRGHAVPHADSALPPAEHLHHASLGTAGAARLRSRELREDRSLRHGIALRRAKVNVCTASGLVLDATRNDPQNQTRIPGSATWPPCAQKGCFPLTDCLCRSDRRSASSSSRGGTHRREVALVPPAHARFVLALPSSFCTVFFTASRPTRFAPFSAVLEVNSR